MTSPTPVLRVRGLQVTRGEQEVLRGVDLDALPGRVHVVLGASGSGKSTLLRAVVGLVPRPSTVRAAELGLRADGATYDLTQRRTQVRVRGRHIGLVGQDPALDLTPLRRVGSLVDEALGGEQTPVPQVVRRCGLPDGLERRRAFELSGGMAQRLALGLAGARDPELLLADEPSTALDALARQLLADHLRDVAGSGSAVVLVTHDVELARRVADDVTVLVDGRVVEHGPAGRVLHHPSTEQTRSLVAVRTPAERPTAYDPADHQRDQRVLEVSGLVAGWGRRPVLDGMDLHVHRAEVVGVLGRSGAGKSTLVACLTGLLRPTGGRIQVAGREAGAGSGTGWREVRRLVQLVPQDPRGSLNPWRRVADQVRDPLDVHRVGTARERTERVSELLDRVGLGGLGHRRPGALSTGQCQRAAIARALVLRPALLLADEPVTALDAALRAEVLELFGELAADDGTATLVISHDLRVLEHLADRIAVLDQGRIVEELAADEVRRAAQHPLTRALVAAHAPTASPLRVAGA